jgi:light-regulated signal transduction histidine kinase (bacteriophytochrome)
MDRIRSEGAAGDRAEPAIERPVGGGPRRPAPDRTGTLGAAHADLLRRIERLERANAELAAFGAALAHDLAEGVATIAYFADALETTLGSDPDAARRPLAGIRAGAEHSQELIAGALRTIDGAGDAPLQPVDANEVLRDARANLIARLAPVGAKIVAGRLPQVAGQKTELVRLFQNLLANAVSFRDPRRPLQIRVAAAREASRWRFEIADNGVGIGNGASRREPPGIGLAICRRIVAAHGGRLGLETGPDGEGTTVSFDLPAVEGAPRDRS